MFSSATAVSPAEGILVIRLSSMGDILHTLPAAAALKQRSRGVRLSWAVAPRWTPLLEENPFVDEVIPFDRRSWQGLRSSVRRLRNNRYTLAVDFQGLIQSAVAARLSGAPVIHGFARANLREKPAAFFYHRGVEAHAAHVVDQNLELAAGAGAARSAQPAPFPLPQGREEGRLPAGGFVLASPLAGWPSKQWPMEYWRALAPRLLRDWGMPLVLDGPPDARELLESVPSAIPHLSSLRGLIHATRRAAAVIGLDSGPMHLAAALGKPGVALFGPTDPARNGPYGGTLEVLRQAGAATTYKRSPAISESMRSILPEHVEAALNRRLARVRVP